MRHTLEDWEEMDRHKEAAECCEHGLHRHICPVCYIEPSKPSLNLNPQGYPIGMLKGSTT